MITTVTMNPAIDRTITLKKFTYGDVNRVSASREDMGGKGINVSRILLTLGSDSTAIGFIGKSNYTLADTLLRADGIPTNFVFVNAPTRINMKLLDSSKHTTTDINEAGFAVSEKELDDLRHLIDISAAASSFIVFSGSVPKGLPATIYRDLIRRVPTSCKTVLDADGALLMKGLEAEPFLIKPNIHELESALGRPLDGNSAIVEAACELIRQYNITYVLVSLGADGSILVNKDQAVYAAPLPVSVKGTVGAGDSMLAGFIHGLSENYSLSAALAWATACGALAVSQEGTQAFKKEEVQKLAAAVHISTIG